ncbi:DUF262 domain-containing protein [Desulfobacterales bacterium HSG2]|nr:DUF262 domain-containing protein [Desulfobacterales bacterium HSG2]
MNITDKTSSEKLEFDSQEVEEWFESEDVEDAPKSAPSSEELLSEKYSKSQLRIVRTTIDYSLYTLKQSLSDRNYINLSPGYQRRNRWDIRKKSQLIESFLMNIPVPPIFLFEKDYNQYEVMDGRQRLEAINSYLNNIFLLEGLEFWKELEGLMFDELPMTIQRGLLRRTLSAIVLLAETSQIDEPETDVRMALFKRLNTGGVQLNPQELRNALYPGKFNDMLIRIARSELFTRVWGIPPKTPDEEENPSQSLIKSTLYKTMADCELVLRFFAIKETILSNLRGSLRRLLDQCMLRHQDDTAENINAQEEHFTVCLNKLFKTFDHRPFVLPAANKPSRPLYDALMVATSLNDAFDPIPHKAQILTRLNDKLANSHTYDILVGRDNTIEAIKKRVQLAEEILLGETK